MELIAQREAWSGGTCASFSRVSCGVRHTQLTLSGVRRSRALFLLTTSRRLARFFIRYPPQPPMSRLRASLYHRYHSIVVSGSISQSLQGYLRPSVVSFTSVFLVLSRRSSAAEPSFLVPHRIHAFPGADKPLHLGPIRPPSVQTH